jgi:putative heme-binding domain-containing protein
VDATAVTLDKEGNIYFGLLVADYSNPYRLRKRKVLKAEEKVWLVAHNQSAEGDPEAEVSLYDINSVRGTIQKWSSKTKKLETIATGIRVPYALAFNPSGDLFVTDQEGETWCPNGNPLDELNHIIPGHNYGFPPRQEKWLPNLVSDPPVVAFGPQHQSSCGFVFNEPKKGQGLFGPKWWEGDAFVAGESRGKLWRVRLVKTPFGYIGKEYIIARLSLLTTDVAISPKGELYVSCHGGLPDWGTGPKGEGKIFKISYTNSQAPQPVAAWPQWTSRYSNSITTDVRVAFAKPVDPSITNHAADMRLEYGEFVGAGDRFELLKPPYVAVKHQEASPRQFLKVRAARLENHGRLLVLDTEPIVRAVPHALTVPGVKAPGQSGAGATVDLEFDLFGAETFFQTRPPLSQLPTAVLPLAVKVADQLGALETVVPHMGSGYLPHPDLAITERLMQPFGRTPQPWLDSVSRKPGLLRRSARLNLPAEASTFRVSGSKTFSLDALNRIQQATQALGGLFVAELNLPTTPRGVEFSVQTDTDNPVLRFTYTLKGEATERPMARQHFLLEWVPTNAPPEIVSLPAPLLTGGDYERGRELFFGDQLKCAICHRLRGEGGAIGPDLGNLISRDAGSVLRDIKEPSASINPDFVAYQLTQRDDSELTGFIRTQDADSLHFVAADGKETVVRAPDVKELRPSSLSLMPAGLLDTLNDGQIRDLLTFLLHEPPKRTRAEVEKILSAGPVQNASALNIVLVAGKQDHGPGQHDYPAWQKRWHALLETKAKVSDAWDWPSPEQFQQAGVVVFYFWNHDWNPERLGQLDDFLARGGGIVLLHSATIGNDQADLLAERTGLASYASPRTKYRHTPLELNLVAPADNAITRGLPATLHLLDEPYWPLTGDPKQVEVLATAKVDDEACPLIWTFQKGKGRVFASIVGHYTWTLDDPLYRILVLRGIAWSAGADPTALEQLATKETDLK